MVINEIKEQSGKKYKDAVLLFGEGNFLRAFIGDIFQNLNDKGLFDGGIVALQGTEVGTCDLINGQNGAYNIIYRGVEKGTEIDFGNRFVYCLNRCINPYTDYEEYLKNAENPDIKVIISNTTEFGICYSEDEHFEDKMHSNYPAKLTDFLYRRYKFFGGDKDKGLIFLPCELIDKNGATLKSMILRYAADWKLENDFAEWLDTANVFANTLVDRIVSGFPKNDFDRFCTKLGYTDNLLDVCEPFLFWAIEGDAEKINSVLHFDKCDFNITVQDDITYYRSRKVRMLNGCHTMSILAGLMSGFDIVKDLLDDKVFNEYIRLGVYGEIIDSLGDNGTLVGYADDLMSRFSNPYLNHKLESISLNSVSKIKARVMPSVKEYVEKFGKCPKILSFSFASLIKFYTGGGTTHDEKVVTDEFERIMKTDDIVKNTLGSVALWGEDYTLIPDFENTVRKYYDRINAIGVYEAVKELVEGYEG